MGVQNQIYAHKIKLVGGTKRVVEKSRILTDSTTKADLPARTREKKSS